MTRPLTNVIIPMKSSAYLSKGWDTLFDSFRDEMPEDFIFFITASDSLGTVLVRTNTAGTDLAHKIVDVAEEVLS